jgi:hypothetical protein
MDTPEKFQSFSGIPQGSLFGPLFKTRNTDVTNLLHVDDFNQVVSPNYIK